MDLPITHTDEEALPVVLGVDTHVEAHVAVALDGLGERLGHKTVPATEAGYALLAAWAEEFGVLERAGVEGSGSFGVGLTRFLRARGVEVVEVNRPNRQHRRRFGKHDTADAEAAARALQANTATGEPKSADGPAEMVRALHVVRRSAVKARTQAANQLRALLVTAPEGLKAELRGLSTTIWFNRFDHRCIRHVWQDELPDRGSAENRRCVSLVFYCCRTAANSFTRE